MTIELSAVDQGGKSACEVYQVKLSSLALAHHHEAQATCDESKLHRWGVGRLCNNSKSIC